MLDKRKQFILKAIVDDYIKTAEPVGSKRLVQRYGIKFSSATVRSIMADLEKQGYLLQPHTSAGRIPSDKGYRTYVDGLMDQVQLDESSKQRITTLFKDQYADIPQLLKRAVTALSQSTGYTAMAVAPNGSGSHLKQLKILMIEPGRALIVVVVQEGLVKNRMANVSSELTLEQLMVIAGMVEQGLAGQKLEDITLVTIETVVSSAAVPESLLNQVLYEAYISIKEAENIETYTDGIENILKHPDFKEANQAHAFANLIIHDGSTLIATVKQVESKRRLKEVDGQVEPACHSAVNKQHYMVRIGQEIAVKTLENCSLVTTTYVKDDQVLGNISVVGPKWMVYQDVIAKIGFVRSIVSGKLNERDHRD